VSETTLPRVGQPAPAFRARTTGGELGLEDFRGRPLVLYFFPKADTAG
jgi:peroxiredoxin Q/BCP